ncbi:zinc ribbon domain-containing protein [Gordonia sp. CPCC 205515]|uniref:FmdB family zinc ribbon protein n=1 Tax=Gordonia sp. CPCC 205515 TaxID=3140791 RepID=UPI003AF35967
MPTYVFRCPGECADVTEQYSMAAVPDSVHCPECDAAARRIIGAPSLGVGRSVGMRLQDATRATADTPQVVSSPPRGGRATPVTSNPLHRKLPRP